MIKDDVGKRRKTRSWKPAKEFEFYAKCNKRIMPNANSFEQRVTRYDSYFYDHFMNCMKNGLGVPGWFSWQSM